MENIKIIPSFIDYQSLKIILHIYILVVINHLFC